MKRARSSSSSVSNLSGAVEPGDILRSSRLAAEARMGQAGTSQPRPSSPPAPMSEPGASASKSDGLKRSTADRTLSCAECRRLKFKCDREWPCSMCRKRGVESLCPDGVQESRKAPRSKVDDAVLEGLADLQRKVDFLVQTARAAGPSTSGATSLPFSAKSSASEKAGSARPESSASALSGLGSHASALHSLADAAMAGPSTAAFASPQLALASPRDPAALSLDRRGHGTLAVAQDGRTHYVGPNAQSIYLARDRNEGSSGRETRPGSPVDGLASAGASAAMPADPSRWQYDTPPDQIEHTAMTWVTPGIRSPHSTAAILAHLQPRLPPREQALRLASIYFATWTYMWDPLPRSDFDEIFSAFYDARSDQVSAVEPHRLAVLFMVLSLGAHFDERTEVSSILSRSLYSNAWGALSLSNFTEVPSLEALTALHLMGLYLTSRKGGRYAESFYGLMGLAMRLAIAMGLHRDPGTWNLPQEMRERRRRIFWELHAFDVFRNLAFCRPPALLEGHLDVQLPQAWHCEPGAPLGAAFHAMKCSLVRLHSRILNECLCSNTSTYASTLAFDAELRQLQHQTLPCMEPLIIHAQAQAPPSRALQSGLIDDATSAAMREELQRHTHGVNLHQAFLLLHRAWFVKSLQESDGDPLSGPFAKSMVAVSESASKVIVLVRSLFYHYPTVLPRFYFLWNGVFSAAAVQGLHVVRAPGSLMSTTAFENLQNAIALLELAAPQEAALSLSLSILRRLLRRAERALSGGRQARDAGTSTGNASDEEPAELDLVGEQTRLLSHRNRGKINDSKSHASSLPLEVPGLPSRGLEPAVWQAFDADTGPFVSERAGTAAGADDTTHLLQLLGDNALAWDDLTGWEDLLAQI